MFNETLQCTLVSDFCFFLLPLPYLIVFSLSLIFRQTVRLARSHFVDCRNYFFPFIQSTNIPFHTLATTALNRNDNMPTEAYCIQTQYFQFRVFPCCYGVLIVGTYPLPRSLFWNRVNFAMMLYFNTDLL